MGGESGRRLGRKAGDLLVILTVMMMVVSVREMIVLREIDLEIAAHPGKNIMQLL